MTLASSRWPKSFFATGAAAVLVSFACGTEGGSPSTPSASAPVLTSVVVTSSSGATGSLAAGQTLQLSAAPRDQEGNAIAATVNWSSSATSVATVSTGGLITAVGAGSATITALATAGSRTASSTFSLSVAASEAPLLTAVVVSAGATTIVAGSTLQLTAIPRDQNGASIAAAVTWSSSAQSVATVSTAGLVAGATVGTSTITATATSGTTVVTGTATITVQAAAPVLTTVTLTPATSTVSAGGTVQLTATARDQNAGTVAATIVWSSSAISIATVTQSGVVTGVGAGSATITAQATFSGTSVSASRLMSVSDPAPALTSVQVTGGTAVVAGSALQLTAIPRDQNGAPIPATVSWSSSNTGRATVNASGLVSGVSAGTADITATAMTGGAQVSNFVTITVSPAAFPSSAMVTTPGNRFSPSTVDIAVGGTVTWSLGGAHNVIFAAAAGVPADIPTGNGGDRTFNTKGNFSYECTLHGGMIGLVRVH